MAEKFSFTVSVTGRPRPAAGLKRTSLLFPSAARIATLSMAPTKNRKIAANIFRGTGAKEARI